MASLLKTSSKHVRTAERYYLPLLDKKRSYSAIPRTDQTTSPDKQNPVGQPENPESDYVGPVCSRSNLRPVRYSTRFSGQSFVDNRVQKTNPQHPYSLQEFQSDPIQPTQPLSELKARLELEDLECCFFKKRVDKFNQTFWESQSTRFEEYEAQVKLKALQNNDATITPKSALQEHLDCSLDEFYRSWLIQEKEAFMKYNWEWWRLQPALMKGGWKAHMRNLKWKLACWKYNSFFFTKSS